MFATALPVLPLHAHQSLINISSDSVPRGVPNCLHHVTSKSAIIGMTNAMAREPGQHGITVNCIRLGAIDTEVERTATLRDQLASYAEQA